MPVRRTGRTVKEERDQLRAWERRFNRRTAYVCLLVLIVTIAWHVLGWFILIRPLIEGTACAAGR